MSTGIALRRGSYKRVLIAVVAMALALGAYASVAAPPSEALSTYYCGRLVDDYFGGGSSNRCHESTSQHTWNYNESKYAGTVNLQNICAAITLGYSDQLTDGIYGSGCWGSAQRYVMCHAAVAYTYYGWLAQSDYGSRHTINGFVETGTSCPRAYALRKSAKSGRTSLAKVRKSAVRGLLATMEGVDSKGVGADDADSAKAVGPTNSKDGSVYAVSSGDQACQILVLGDFSAQVAACGVLKPGEQVLSGTGVTAVPGGVAVWGAAPADADHVTVSAGGRTITAPATNGGYLAVVKDWPTALSVVEKDGATQPVRLPTAP
jgi:hypothetical protein